MLVSTDHLNKALQTLDKLRVEMKEVKTRLKTLEVKMQTLKKWK